MILCQTPDRLCKKEHERQKGKVIGMISSKLFGTTKDGREVTMYSMKNSHGLEVTFLDLGAVIVNLMLPDAQGKFEDVVLGYDTVEEYEVNGPSYGAPLGRCGNRISNAAFKINDKTYKLDNNNEGNCLHSGYLRFNHLMYEAECLESEGEDAIVFSRVSPDMEQGFPGNFEVSITYKLNDDDELIIEYSGISDKDTVVNMTNHSYFNLGPGGHLAGDVLDEKVKIYASRYTPTYDDLLPTGEYADVADTPLDFRDFKRIGQDIRSDFKAIRQAKGYDHNYVLDHAPEEVSIAAELIDEKSGRKMEVWTDLPGLQFYTANTMVETGKGGNVYREFNAVCFETQFFPDACNVPNFPTTILKAGEEYSHVTVFRFETL